MYTTSKEMILAAQRGGYAVPAFNFENMEMVQAILAAAEETASPVLLQTTPSTIKYMTLRQAYAMVKAEADAVRVPVCLHLDHCESYEGVCAALEAGYSSVMIDASKLGEKRKEGKNQKTVLRPDEVRKIEDTFINQDVIEDFSVSVTYEQIAEKNYSLSAGQYFEVRIEFVELSQEAFENRMRAYSSNLEKLFSEGKALEEEIRERLGELRYE